MEAEAAVATRGYWRVCLEFAALAVLVGVASAPIFGMLSAAFQSQTHAAQSLSMGLAGAALLAVRGLRRDTRPNGSHWLAALILLVPQWCAMSLALLGDRAVPGLHGLGWGAVLLLGLAAPLWVGLASSLELVSEETPRVVVGAAILGIGAIFLVIPESSYNLQWSQMPMLGLQVLLGVVTVISWAMARDRLRAVSALGAASCYLLLSAAGETVFALLLERSHWQPVEGRAAGLPLLLNAALAALVWWLWFWLLQRMTLAAFGMRAMAAWTAAVIPGFAYAGFGEWRIDAAVVVSLGACVVALRARAEEEQPLALGLGGE